MYKLIRSLILLSTFSVLGFHLSTCVYQAPATADQIVVPEDLKNTTTDFHGKTIIIPGRVASNFSCRPLFLRVYKITNENGQFPFLIKCAEDLPLPEQGTFVLSVVQVNNIIDINGKRLTILSEISRNTLEKTTDLKNVKRYYKLSN